ncbi:hypothetical protein PIB30_114832, partial [Stylosanthes scabra]|nr:hypothetical protein [Stylosanthes scabra]
LALRFWVSRARQRSGGSCVGGGPGCGRAARTTNLGPALRPTPWTFQASGGRGFTAFGGNLGRPACPLRPPSKEQLRTGTDQGNPTV